MLARPRPRTAMRHLIILGLLLAGAPGLAVAGEDDDQRVLATADAPVPRRFVIWSEEGVGFIKPIIQISSSVVAYAPESETNDQLVGLRGGTLLLSRFGFEGQLYDWISFRTLIERNIGFSFTRGGPIGTGIWEGTGSFQPRENFVRLSRWGLTLTGGIFPDPASVDYVSAATLDLFGMDPYVRDPLLYSGFNQGQGVMLRYGRTLLPGWDADAGISFTAGNPLVSSLSFGFGGNVSAFNSLFGEPLRSFTNNSFPGSDIQVYILSPSLTSRLDLGAVDVGLRLAGQFYWVDPNVTQEVVENPATGALEGDAELTGYNLRSSLEVRMLDGLRVFGSFAYRSNQQNGGPTALAELSENDFFGLVAAGGAEWVWRDWTVGGQYYRIIRETSPAEGEQPAARDVLEYVAAGVGYALKAPNLYTGLRYGRSTAANRRAQEDPLSATDTVILSLRLLI